MPALAGDLATLKQMTSLAALGIQAATPGCGRVGRRSRGIHARIGEDDLETGTKKGNKKIDGKDKKKKEAWRRRSSANAARRIPALTKEFACERHVGA